MGSRRTHEDAALAAARAAYIAGFASTSNLEAGRRYGVPTTGTSAHAFTLIHDDEPAAFRAQVAALGSATTLLVDTYDVATAVRTAVEVAGPDLGAVRIDSGDLVGLAREVRGQLDSLGAHKTRIVVTSDLDEHAIATLASAPVDGYGVGTSVVTGSGLPTASLVYKLVARAESDQADAAWRAVTKASPGKIGHGGRKQAYRRHSPDGVAQAEIIYSGIDPVRRSKSARQRDDGERALLVPLVRGGEVVGREPLADARARHAATRAALPPEALRLQPGGPALDTIFVESPSHPR
jgi:nicotinate phosphoribosyltransferase